jgi:hypothetical protein
VADSVSGLFFDSSTPRQIAAAVRRSADVVWNAQQIIQHAESFSEERFIHQIRSQAEELLP